MPPPSLLEKACLNKTHFGFCLLYGGKNAAGFSSTQFIKGVQVELFQLSGVGLMAFLATPATQLDTRAMFRNVFMLPP
jgi:hypothetical protein